MKKGAGDDPFADDATEAVEVEPESGPEEDKPDTAIASQEDSASTTPPSPVGNQNQQGTSKTAAQQMENLPYLAQRQLRGKSVKAERDQVPFFLREAIQRQERDLQRAVEDQLGQEINKTDLREAAYVFAQRNPEGVVAVLREWGVDYLD